MKYKRGFTLVELLVIIAIIAILATIGIAVYSNAPKGARDAKRKSDIDAIAKALEVNKSLNGTYNALSDTNFSSRSFPSDPGNTYKYCVMSSASEVELPLPTAWNNSACPTSPTSPSSYEEISSSAPPNSTKVWIICAHLENEGGNPPVYCASNSQ